MVECQTTKKLIQSAGEEDLNVIRELLQGVEEISLSEGLDEETVVSMFELIKDNEIDHLK